VRGLNKNARSAVEQPIGRIPGEQDLPWDAASITQIQRTGLKNPDFGSVYVRGRVARPFTRRVPVTSDTVRTSSVCRRFAAGRPPDDRNSGGCGPTFVKRRPLQCESDGTLRRFREQLVCTCTVLDHVRQVACRSRPTSNLASGRQCVVWCPPNLSAHKSLEFRGAIVDCLQMQSTGSLACLFFSLACFVVRKQGNCNVVNRHD
jgi:hypothetical protein